VVYAPDKALRALENFITETNLTALRELALRQAAHQVEDHRQAARPSGSAEKILIHLTADPTTAMLIRRGRRVADYLQAECLAVCVEQDGTPEERSAIEKHLGFARSLRIETTILTGHDTAKAIADFARERKVTQLFIGRHSKDARRIVDNARDIVVTVAAARRR
jgi:two-component system sensor histidine kinase KdpD